MQVAGYTIVGFMALSLVLVSIANLCSWQDHEACQLEETEKQRKAIEERD